MKRNSIFLIVALFTVLLSCNSDEKMNSKGLLRISVATDKSVVTKAEDDVEISSIRLIVKETTESGDGWSKEYDLSPDAPTEEIELAPGVYQLTAIAGDGSEDTDSFSPCYKGSSTVTIEAGSNTETEITCQLATVKVAVTYASNVKDIYKNGFKTEVGGLTFTEEKIGTAGYLAANPFSVKFWYVDNTGGWRSISVGDVDQVNPREYYHINIEVKNEGEGAATISVKVGDTNKQDIKVEIILPEVVISTLVAENVEFTTATLKGTYVSPSNKLPANPEFKYRIKGIGTWSSISGKAAGAENCYAASLSNLEKDTEYEFSFMGKGEVLTFITKDSYTPLDEEKAMGSDVAYVYGLLNENVAGDKYFEYKLASTSDDQPWEKAFADLCQGQSNKYEAKLSGLIAGQTYKYRFMQSKRTPTFTTYSSITVKSVTVGADYAKIKWSIVPEPAESDKVIVDYKYKKLDALDWIQSQMITIPFTKRGDEDARILNLEQNGTYCIEDEKKSFTTLYNANFDNWYTFNKAQYAGIEGAETNCFWDSGNVGAATLKKNPTSQENSIVKSGSSAKLASQFVGIGIGKFAAGNIYTGRYMQTYTFPMGARIRFGREFVTRPTQFKGWYQYQRGTNIDYGDHNKEELTSSGGDKCAIYIGLTDNAGLVDGDGVKTAYEVDNNNNNSPTRYTIDLSTANSDVVAYGSITDEQSKGTGAWESFSIDIDYRKPTNKPTFIIIIASASKYGDFFTGSKSSLMYIDDFELVYDYSLPPYK